MKKYNLLFDGTILTNEFHSDSARSGIFFTAKNIFNEMLKREDIKIYLYCELGKYQLLREYLKKYNLENDIEIINGCEYTKLYDLKFKSRNLKSKFDKKKQPVKRALSNLVYPVLSLVCKVYENIYSHKELKEKLKNMDFYFSPATKTPNIIKKVKNVQTSVLLHDTIPLIFSEVNVQVFSSKYWICELVKSFSKKEIYFANSQCTKHDFLRYSKKLKDEQITVTPLAISEQFVPNKDMQRLEQAKKKYNIPNDKKYIFSLCTLEPRKNLIRAVKTFVQFVEKNNIEDLIFVLGGGHWDNFIDKLEKEVDNLDKYKNRIVKAGYIDDEDLSVLYSGAQWFVYTSQYEGFGLPPLEAMSCGCPVITSNNSSIPEVVGDSGIMIDWDNDEQHIQAYEQYYFNDNLRQENADKGLNRAKQFSWSKCADQIVSKLKETISA